MTCGSPSAFPEWRECWPPAPQEVCDCRAGRPPGREDSGMLCVQRTAKTDNRDQGESSGKLAPGFLFLFISSLVETLTSPHLLPCHLQMRSTEPLYFNMTSHCPHTLTPLLDWIHHPKYTERKLVWRVPVYTSLQLPLMFTS